MWGVETKTGDALTLDNVRYFYVTIPGQPNLKLTFGGHGSGPAETKPWYWTVNWDVPAGYPLGVVPFKMLVRTKDGKRDVLLAGRSARHLPADRHSVARKDIDHEQHSSRDGFLEAEARDCRCDAGGRAAPAGGSRRGPEADPGAGDSRAFPGFAGPVAPAAQPAETMGILKATPDTAPGRDVVHALRVAVSPPARP